jgi:hypothetical protein
MFVAAIAAIAPHLRLRLSADASQADFDGVCATVTKELQL